MRVLVQLTRNHAEPCTYRKHRACPRNPPTRKQTAAAGPREESLGTLTQRTLTLARSAAFARVTASACTGPRTCRIPQGTQRTHTHGRRTMACSAEEALASAAACTQTVTRPLKRPQLERPRARTRRFVDTYPGGLCSGLRLERRLCSGLRRRLHSTQINKYLFHKTSKQLERDGGKT